MLYKVKDVKYLNFTNHEVRKCYTPEDYFALHNDTSKEYFLNVRTNNDNFFIIEFNIDDALLIVPYCDKSGYAYLAGKKIYPLAYSFDSREWESTRKIFDSGLLSSAEVMSEMIWIMDLLMNPLNAFVSK